VGVDAFLGNDSGPLSFRGMLRAYSRDAAKPIDKVRRQLERALDDARRAIMSAGLALEVVATDTGLYTLKMPVSAGFRLPAGVDAGCFPISRSVVDAQQLAAAQTVEFSRMTIASTTGFMAFVVTAVQEGRSMSTGFVLNLRVQGMPAHRDQYVLREVISDPARFIHYLLLILAEDEQMLGSEFTPEESQGAGSWRYVSAVPLLEELVRAFSRHPERMARIQQLVDDLKASPDGASVLPPGFDDLWTAFKSAQATGVQS
jgi:hypothetical protein